MQKLWSLKLSWDESLPCNVDTEWRTFTSQLSFLNNVSILRLVFCQMKTISRYMVSATP